MDFRGPRPSQFCWCFRIYSGFPSVTDSFGAYASSLPVIHFLLFEADMPITSDGAMLAKSQPKGVKPIRVSYLNAAGRVTEQGIHLTVPFNDQSYLVIPGSDPCCGDDWSYGTVYTHDLSTDTLYKYRDTAKLENVVHFGVLPKHQEVYWCRFVILWRPRWLGNCWWDLCKRWSRQNLSRVTKDPHQYINDPSQLLSTYRITDISWFNNRIYIVNGRDGETNEPGLNILKTLAKHGQDFRSDWRWAPRMQVFNSDVSRDEKNRRDFFVIDQANTIHTVQFRYQNQLQAAANVFQVFTVANNYLFVITQDGNGTQN